MTYSEPLPANFQPVACMVCGLLVVNEPDLLERHAVMHALVTVAKAPEP